MANLDHYSVLNECRICVNNEGALPIFGDVNSQDISAEIALCGGIQVDESDGFPQFICHTCFNLLQSALSFRRSAKNADALFRQRVILSSNVQKESVKVEYEIQNVSENNTETLSVAEPDIDFVCVKLDDNVEEESADYKSESTEEQVIEEHIVDFDDDAIIENENEMVMLIVSDENKDLKSYHCKYCQLDFETLEKYEEHRNTVEHKRNYVISFLPKKSRTSNSQNSVQEKETVHPKDQKCEICNRMFTKLHYPRHMNTQHNMKLETSRSNTKRECTVCHKMFHPVALSRHMKKVHSDDKDLPKVKIECPICKKLFSKDFYPLHMQRHKEGDTKKYICDQCGKKFYYKSTFYTHRLIHSKDLPHKCEYCPYRGRTKGLLKTHVRTHTGDYPYKCDQCDTRCITKSNLNAHMQRHRGPVDFICDSCHRGFYTQRELQKHISVIHQGVKNHVCNLCGMSFGYRHGLMSHQLNVHKRAKGVGKAKAVYLKLEEEEALEQSCK
ncbi:zinc-finger associated domain (zf-AD) domain-containing protein [Phthorimaea operculella]|nr:zinc-finger associated domain (zf-AD) domain-containing protein [Phthorimaea operculella]